ncbi:Holo-(acyl-carrier-protein) synthase [Candidatus Sulfobium mesophilum]|uniref:Holo-[acyl-carrier-protein] synthase n=1 Tax=Candidatus Sulfobium mesophilum TaxID=2016548 RepID=A0A2U3QK45_9BACT|nr:Holo-(acyl-carrier-protein) synthase [Candidatus Sulfobium mesophilum]
MIYGIGVDIVEIDRIRDAVDRWGERFLRRVFTEHEIAYSYKKKEPYLPLSVRFAAKEAFIKAISAEIHLAMNEIEVINREGGQPFIEVKGRLKTFFEERSIRRVHLSMSHERKYGMACVVVEK